MLNRLALTLVSIGRKFESANMEEKAQEYFKRAVKIRKEYINLETQYDYKKIYEILNKRKIKFIAVQYPTLSVDDLKILFDGDEDIIFVSNEEDFKKELSVSRYEEIFRDSTWITFGHLTEKGADMVAENVANAVLNHLGIKQYYFLETR